jgi:hypothetical protein
MADSNRTYCLEAANDLIPTLREGFFRIMQMQQLLEISIQNLNECGYTPKGDIDLSSIQNPEIMDHLSDLKVLIRALQDEVKKINDYDCKIINLANGHVYIPSPFAKQDKRIYFCWSLGDRSIVDWNFKGLPFNRKKNLNQLPDWARSHNASLDLVHVDAFDPQEVDTEVC